MHTGEARLVFVQAFPCAYTARMHACMNTCIRACNKHILAATMADIRFGAEQTTSVSASSPGLLNVEFKCAIIFAKLSWFSQR